MRCRSCGELIGNFSLTPDEMPRWAHLIGVQTATCPDGSGNEAAPESPESEDDNK